MCIRDRNKATRKLFPVANTPAKILALGVEGLENHIKTIGPVSYTHLTLPTIYSV